MEIKGILSLTLRELWAKKIVVGTFIVCSFLWVMMTFALNLDVVDGSLAAVRIFGVEPTDGQVQVDEETGERTRTEVPLSDTINLDELVFGIEAFVGGVAYWAAILLALFTTASLIPNLLQRGNIDLLLAKPLSRARLLFGRLLGVWITVSILVIYLLGAIWLVMSFKSGIWNPNFLLSILITVFMFMVMYSVVTLLAIAVRSTALALIITYGIIFASIFLGLREELEPLINQPWREVYLGFYHVLPNFSEVTMDVVQLARKEAVDQWYPFISSLLFGTAMYAFSFYLFARKDF